MSLTQIFKRVLIPCAAGVANAADSEGHTYGSNCVKRAPPGTKPSDLPIYSKDCEKCREATQCPPPVSGMEETVGNIRKELWVWQDNLKGYRHKIIDVYRRGFSKADCPSEKTQARNHLESCFDEKQSTDEIGENASKKPCRPLSAGPKFEKLRMDRCGRPCTGSPRPINQCQSQSQQPQSQPQCQYQAQSQVAQMQVQSQTEMQTQMQSQTETETQPPCRQTVSQKPYLCRRPSKPPPSEGSNGSVTKESCPCCHKSECSGTK